MTATGSFNSIYVSLTAIFEKPWSFFMFVLALNVGAGRSHKECQPLKAFARASGSWVDNNICFLTPFTPCFTDCYKVSWMNYPKASLNESLFVFSRYISCQVSCDGIQLKLTYSKTLPMHDSVTELETTSNIKRCQNRVCISEVTLRQWLNFAQSGPKVCTWRNV